MCTVVLSRAERLAWVDLRPYMDATPVTVHMHAPLERAHRLFTRMGMRHLLVTNDAHDCVGVLTRSELTEHRLTALWATLDAEAAAAAAGAAAATRDAEEEDNARVGVSTALGVRGALE